MNPRSSQISDADLKKSGSRDLGISGLGTDVPGRVDLAFYSVSSIISLSTGARAYGHDRTGVNRPVLAWPHVHHPGYTPSPGIVYMVYGYTAVTGLE